MQFIVSRNFNGAPHKFLSLARCSTARKMQIDPAWQILRIGIRIHINTFASVSAGPVLAVGLCSGTVNKYADPTTDHFLGARWSKDDEWGYSSSVGTVSTADLPELLKRIGTTDTEVTYTNISSGANTIYLNGSAQQREAIYVEFQKGSPWTVMLNWPSHYANTDVTLDAFQAGMDAASMGEDISNDMEFHLGSGNAIRSYGTADMAVDEDADGVLDAINLYWKNGGAPLDVCDVKWRKIS